MKRIWPAAAALLLLLSCESSPSGGGLPADADLESRFRQSRPLLERLAAMAREDARLIRIAPSFLTVNDPAQPGPRPGTESDLPHERWDHYRSLFRKCGLSDGLLSEKVVSQTGVFFPVATRQVGADSLEKGWAHLLSEPENLVTSLVAIDLAAHRPKTFFMRIESNWYQYGRYNE